MIKINNFNLQKIKKGVSQFTLVANLNKKNTKLVLMDIKGNVIISRSMHKEVTSLFSIYSHTIYIVNLLKKWKIFSINLYFKGTLLIKRAIKLVLQKHRIHVSVLYQKTMTIHNGPRKKKKARK